MRNIFCLDTARIRDFDNYQKTIVGLANDELTPGAKPETLAKFKGGILCSARETGADRLIYAEIHEGPDAGGIVLCGVGDDHDYDTILRRLRVRQTSKTYSEYAEANIAEGVAEEVEPKDGAGYHKINPYHKHFITLDTHQEDALKVSLPAIIYGPPGSGKTLVVAQMLFERALAFGKQGGIPPGILYLAPTADLAATAQRHYEEACQAYLNAGGVRPEAGFAPVIFSTYADFYKHHTVEGKAHPEGKPSGFIDFQAWYNSKPHLKKKNAPSAEDCWAAFGLCSLYSEMKDYLGLGEDQCVIPRDRREIVYRIFSDYKSSCDKDGIYSEWVRPFTCEEQFGLVVLDESQTRSGSAISSYLNLADERQIVYVVGGHQANMDEQASSYGRGADGATLLKVALHSEGISFSSVNLRRTYRNPETVVNLSNHIIHQKKLSGLHSLVKGTDGHLVGHNGYAGEASFIYETEQDQVEGLKERFAHRADVCVITPPDRVEIVREMWPGVAVLTRFQAMGLEFKHVVCVGLLSRDEKNLHKVCKILNSKYGIDSREAIPLEPWFNGLIASISRATEGVHIIDAKLHPVIEMFEKFKGVCGKKSPEETQAEKSKPLASSPEQWLELATRFLSYGVPDEALRLMNANVPDKTCSSYLTFKERYDASLKEKEKALKAKPAVTLSPASKKKTSETLKTNTNIDAKQPETQEKIADPVLVEPVLVNDPPVKASNSSSAEEDEAGPAPEKKKKKKKKIPKEDKKLSLVTLEPTKEQCAQVKSFVFAANFSKKGLQDIFNDEHATLLLLQIPIQVKSDKFENLIQLLLSDPHYSTQFLYLLEVQSPRFIAKFFNAIDSRGRSGLGILLYNLAKSIGSVETVHNLFKKHETLYRAVTYRTWYLKSETSFSIKQCSLEIIVDHVGKGGIKFLSDLLTHNSELFGLDFVELLTTKLEISIKQLSRVFKSSYIYKVVTRCDANDFLLKLVENNKSVLNEKFVNALCEPVNEEDKSVLWIMCSQSTYHPFINHLLNKSLASPKLEQCREQVIHALCRESKERSPLGMLIFNLYINETDQILKNFINQYVKFFDSELLGNVLSSLSKVNISGADTTSLFMTLYVGNGRGVLSAILTKLPGVAAYITPDALGFNFSQSHREALRDTLGEEWDNILIRLFILNAKLLQYHILREKTHGVPLFHRLLAVDNGLSTLKMAFSETPTLRSEITEEDLFTPYSYGEGEAHSLYFKLSLEQQGLEILELIFAANPALLKDATLSQPSQGLLPTFSMFQSSSTSEKQPGSPLEESVLAHPGGNSARSN